MKTVLIGVMSVAVVLVLADSSGAQDAKGDKGKAVFADQKCTLCHSVAAKGNAKGPLDEVGTTFTADEIRQWIVDPAGMSAKHKADRKPPMPAKYKALPKDDLDALVAYLSSLKKK
jgi:mono/diheme cytochrome c family protein